MSEVQALENNAVLGNNASGPRGSFEALFTITTGPAKILLICSLLVAFGMGSTIGVVPSIVGDRYARVYYGYNGTDCSAYDRLEKPNACQRGADDAQAAAAVSVLALNLLTLILNPVVGSSSDVRGRRRVIVISMILLSLGPAVFVVLQLIPSMNPFWYYVALSISGAVDYLSMSFASLSDVLPEDIRTAGYGVVLAGFHGGFCLAPRLPLFMSHFQVSVFSCAAMIAAVFVAVFALQETLPSDVAEQNQQIQRQQQQYENMMQSQRRESGTSGNSYSSDGVLLTEQDNDKSWRWVAQTATKPLRDISILNRDNAFRLLAAGSFFSAMVFSSDKTFFVYYIEDQLNVRDEDVAHMFLIFGFVGVVIQAFLLQPMLKSIGEKPLLVIAFISGTCHNALFGLARSTRSPKTTILVALCLSQLTKVNFPLLSSFASRGASVNEQGRVQGALFALNALANAIGPMLLEAVYNDTKNSQSFLGPGTMFLCAAILYAVGTIFVSFLPRVQAVALSHVSSLSSLGDDEEECQRSHDNTHHTLEEPLLQGLNSNRGTLA